MVRDAPPTLLVDLYELTMAQSYFERTMASTPATFSLFSRHLLADLAGSSSRRCGCTDYLMTACSHPAWLAARLTRA